MKKMFYITIAMMLIACMVIPTLAVSGEWGGIKYTLTPVLGATTSKVTMTATNATVQVSAEGRAYVYALFPGERMWGPWGRSTSTVSASVTHYINNYVYDENGTLYTGTIEKVEAQGYIAENMVKRTST